MKKRDEKNQTTALEIDTLAEEKRKEVPERPRRCS